MRTVAEMLRGGQELRLSTKPSVILVIGVNGVGKTTTIGKLALPASKGSGKKVILRRGRYLPCRRHRAAGGLGGPGRGGSDQAHRGQPTPPPWCSTPSAAAKARGSDVIICDTAGRLHNKKNLMDELSENRPYCRQGSCLRPTVKPCWCWTAPPGRTPSTRRGNSRAAAGITGIVLTKLDGTARGRRGAGHSGRAAHPGEVHRGRRGDGRPSALRGRGFCPRPFRQRGKRRINQNACGAVAVQGRSEVLYGHGLCRAAGRVHRAAKHAGAAWRAGVVWCFAPTGIAFGAAYREIRPLLAARPAVECGTRKLL